jgi:two-component system CheB/CheR fusion protein
MDAQFEVVMDFLQKQRGLDFTGYKRPGLTRRVGRRMQMLGVHGFQAYREYLELHPDEFALLCNTILINVTSFFRDAAAWDYLAAEVIPVILQSKAPGQAVRVWSAGCASGEETCTVAMLLAEALGADEFCKRVKIYGTDANQEALAHARLASYSARDLEPVAPPLRERYFEPVNGRHRFRGDLRRCMVFGRHDLVQDAPRSRLDLLVCRNTIMYLNPETQGRILSRFHFALNGEGSGNGCLFLGPAEMVLKHGHLFTPLDLKHRVFARLPIAGVRHRAIARSQQSHSFLESVLSSLRAAAIVVNRNLDVLMWNSCAQELWGLRAEELKGKSLLTLDSGLPVAGLCGLIRSCLSGEAEHQEAVLDAINRRGQAIQCRVACTPLPMCGDKREGVIILMDEV